MINSFVGSTLVSERLRRNFVLVLGSLAFAVWAGPIDAASLSVANPSFESPTTPQGFPAFPVVDDWQKSPEAPSYDPNNFGGLTWDQLSGVFPNTAVGESDHIDNVDGDQASYLFSLQGVGFNQELSDTFQVGQSYGLTVGILGGGNISDGDQFRIGLYYLDAGSAVSVASTDVTYSLGSFPDTTHLFDYEANLSTVQGSDAWAGQNIGIELMAISGNGAGYWDLDNVRLTAVPEPSTITLLALGLGSGLLFAQKKRSSRS